MIYLDANATTPLAPEVLEAMLPWLSNNYANPSGSYWAARDARKAVEQARSEVAELIGANPEEIIFTGSGTESVNSALCSLDKHAGPGVALVTAIEHSAVLQCVDHLMREVVRVPVTSNGRMDLDAYNDSLTRAAYVSVMAANNETGVIQPIREALAFAKNCGKPFHTDAIQAVGKIPMSVAELEVDMLSLSAHKFHGPKGVAALYVRQGLRFEPMLRGGGQEAGRRSSTENTAGIVGMGKAASLIKNSQEDLTRLRDEFEMAVLAGIRGVQVNGDRDYRLPNTSHLSFEDCEAAGLLILLDEAGIACSAGSACMTGKQKPSHVQIAMGISEKIARSSLRFSFSKMNTPDDVLTAAEALVRSVEKLRRVQSAGVGPVSVYVP